MSHTAELIAVGTEILLGNIANTDAQMLSEELAALGVNVLYHTVVGDNPTRLAEALELARRRVDIVITTGGLGPTYDDLTKQAICTVFGRKNVFHPEIANALRTHFASNACDARSENISTGLPSSSQRKNARCQKHPKQVTPSSSTPAR